ncbi:unnamed protein product [Closterium sp. Naga37s-1]|nr:unnamed protein product [Closterium sp. Naga37s-1]
MALDLLSSLISLLTTYLGRVCDDSLKDHFVTVYALLDEAFIGGMPLTSEPAILKELVPPPSLLTKVVDTITGGVGGASATATAATAAANMPAQLGRFFGAAGAAVANSVAQSFTGRPGGEGSWGGGRGGGGGGGGGGIGGRGGGGGAGPSGMGGMAGAGSAGAAAAAAAAAGAGSAGATDELQIELREQARCHRRTVSDRPHVQQCCHASEQYSLKGLVGVAGCHRLKYLQNELQIELREQLDVTVAPTAIELREQLGVTVTPSGLVERCDVYGEAHATCRMSGMPDVALSFVDARVFSDIAFHPSVRYREWDSDRVVALTPPDGNFKLLSYRVRSIPCVPVYVKPQIAFVQDSGRVNVMVGVKHDPGKPVEGLVLLLPLPMQVASCDLQANVGTVAFDTVTKLCTWSIGRMPRDKNPCLSGGLRLSSPLPRPHVHPVLLAQFRIMGAALSGVRIESVVVRGEENRRPHTAFRSATVAGCFQGFKGAGIERAGVERAGVEGRAREGLWCGTADTVQNHGGGAVGRADRVGGGERGGESPPAHGVPIRHRCRVLPGQDLKRGGVEQRDGEGTLAVPHVVTRSQVRTEREAVGRGVELRGELERAPGVGGCFWRSIESKGQRCLGVVRGEENRHSHTAFRSATSAGWFPVRT